jgi:hypothetical protein
MHANAYRILNQSLTEAVAKPMSELQRKNKIAAMGIFLLGAVSLTTSTAWLKTYSRSIQLFEANSILTQGFRPQIGIPWGTSAVPWVIEDGTVFFVNLSLPSRANPI